MDGGEAGGRFVSGKLLQDLHDIHISEGVAEKTRRDVVFRAAAGEVD